LNELVLSILQILGSVGLFLFGMKTTSESLQRLAGERLAGLLQHYAPENLIKGILRGAFINSLIQSSSATSLMTISYVNAGLLSFRKAVNIMMGINIGTAVTTWILALIGSRYMLSSVSLVIIGLFFLLLFSRKNLLKNFAEFAIGFGILLLSTAFLKQSVVQFNAHYPFTAYLSPLINMHYLSILFFLFAGTFATILLQSPSSLLAITLIFFVEGWLSLEAAAALALGENAGTAFHCYRAAKHGNIHAKRAAGFHVFFNVGGVIWIFLFLPFFLALVRNFINVFSLAVPMSENMKMMLLLPVFHGMFHIFNIILWSGFIRVIERYLLDKYPASGKSDDEFHLRYLNNPLMATPELALLEAKKELENFARIIEQMSEALSALLFEKRGNEDAIIQKLMRREEQTDKLELEVVNYLTKLSESELSRTGSQKVRNMLHIANNLERIADIYYQMTKNHSRMEKMGIQFPAEAMHDLKDILGLLYIAIRQMRANMETESAMLKIDVSYEIEDRINAKHKQLTSVNFDRLEKGIYDPRAGVIFMDFINRAERIGDHIVNVNEALIATGEFIVKKIK
jgi:phosphate:Na+ symporter